MNRDSAIRFLLTPLREGRPITSVAQTSPFNFYSRPCGRGDDGAAPVDARAGFISTHAPAGGATHGGAQSGERGRISTHAPAGGATPRGGKSNPLSPYFYSRPCGRGDDGKKEFKCSLELFLLTPLREGRPGDLVGFSYTGAIFLLTPLREGRRNRRPQPAARQSISTHAPAGGATQAAVSSVLDGYISTHAPAGGATELRIAAHYAKDKFLLTPLREGRLLESEHKELQELNFYSRPCGRGDMGMPKDLLRVSEFLLTPLREGRLYGCQ